MFSRPRSLFLLVYAAASDAAAADPETLPRTVNWPKQE